ncbi:MAG TPA: cytochrome c maturation protein CcmE [Candidatus Binataceae bacterium]|nr:cytochrome c maturation protein CcmE [Candidatus Binataceae bacterium]
MRIKPRFLLGGGLIVVAVGYLIYTAIMNTAEYYLTVGEVQARQSELQGQSLRVAGRVVPGSVSWDPSSLRLAFAIAPIPDADASGVKPVSSVSPGNPAQRFKVVCIGQPKPDMFAENRDVIVEGRLGPDQAIVATQVLTSCPSKYVPKKPS